MRALTRLAVGAIFVLAAAAAVSMTAAIRLYSENDAALATTRPPLVICNLPSSPLAYYETREPAQN